MASPYYCCILFIILLVDRYSPPAAAAVGDIFFRLLSLPQPNFFIVVFVLERHQSLRVYSLYQTPNNESQSNKQTQRSRVRGSKNFLQKNKKMNECVKRELLMLTT